MNQATVASGATSSLRMAMFVAQLGIDALPDDVVEHAKLCILDTIGCGLYGSTLPWTTIVREALSDVDTGDCSVVWGTAQSLSPPHAALVNGTAVHAFELDDLHAQSIVHPGSMVLPAALAAASTVKGVDGGRLLVALVAGYEIAARVGMSMGAAHLLAGWHPTGTHGTLGAAAAAGSILGLDSGQMRNAFGTAGSQSAGLMAAQYESMVKRLHAGRAAQSGLYAALLAQRGFIGIADLFEADYGGYGTTFSPHFEPRVLTEGLGRDWEVRRVGFKAYSCNGSCHPTVDVLRHFKFNENLRVEDVRQLDVYVSRATLKHVGWPYVPSTVTTAQMNLAYIAAVTLADGDAFVEQFTPQRVVDPTLIELASRVHVHADPDVDVLGDSARHRTRVSVTLRSGRVLTETRDGARGGIRDPLTRDEIVNKYRRLASTVLDDEAVGRLENCVLALEQIRDIAQLVTMLRTFPST